MPARHPRSNGPCSGRQKKKRKRNTKMASMESPRPAAVVRIASAAPSSAEFTPRGAGGPSDVHNRIRGLRLFHRPTLPPHQEPRITDHEPRYFGCGPGLYGGSRISRPPVAVAKGGTGSVRTRCGCRLLTVSCLCGSTLPGRAMQSSAQLATALVKRAAAVAA